MVHDVVRLTPTIVEVIVRAPIAARAFKPGQFYRLQNYEALAPRTKDTVLGMEGLALTGAAVDHERGLLSTIVLEMGGSSDLCALLKPGEPVILMGPTGTPSETPSEETVLLAGGGLGNAVLFSIGQELRKQGSRVIYFAGYKKIIDRYKVEEIEKAADLVVWVCDEAPGFTAGRVQDSAFVGNIVEAMAAYGRGELGENDSAAFRGPADRDRIGWHDAGSAAGPPRRLVPVPQAGSPRDRQHQFTDAVHDEGNLRAVSPGTQESRDWRSDGGVLLLQSGSAARSWISGACARGFPAEWCWRKVTRLWIDHCLRDIGVRGAHV